MDSRIDKMLSKYNCVTHRDFENALKEIVQEIALLGLWRSKFFERAAFYGGTALRILYGLDRFSEDLDFSLLKADPEFNLDKYNSSVEAELNSFGLEFFVENRTKTNEGAIKSAFIKAGTKEQMMNIQVPSQITSSIHDQQFIRVKMEVDIDPPGDFETEVKNLLQPMPFGVITYRLPDLFAGKMHAVLCRKWLKRIKGRDWYDFVWYVGNNVPIGIVHLKERLVQSNSWDPGKPFKLEDLLNLLYAKIDEIDFELAKQDVMPFVKDPKSLELWSKEFFRDVASRIEVV